MRIIENYDNAILDDVAAGVVTQYETAKTNVIAAVNAITPDDTDTGYEIQITVEVYNTTEFKSIFLIRDMAQTKTRVSTINMFHNDALSLILLNYADTEAAGLAWSLEEFYKRAWVSKL